ncbi:iron donor protein CyaY [Vibrio nitrifigilis]|uniref:Iron-sulfur cluster assembly protein CyaY n=1 Tax=Vibrio nitrifigilis TaxID=2789781 RepID=A0ABS0GHP8_9VIBR|nr:iron donor protein CyaY [Vibrio nitrifigilis]MBF9001959.1 iron donor protein CyaY [Vibrio nitrifigilis]
MNETEFHQLVDAQLETLEEMIDNSGADIDYENVGNVLTLEFEDRSQVIINRQEPMKEIWLASRAGGFHFRYDGNNWLCTKTGIEFITMVKTECEKHAGEHIEWED